MILPAWVMQPEPTPTPRDGGRSPVPNTLPRRVDRRSDTCGYADALEWRFNEWGYQ